MVRQAQSYYLVPTRSLRSLVLALLLTISINVAGIIMQLASYERGQATLVNGASFPFSPRPVALEVVDSERYGMEDDNDWASVTPQGHGFIMMGEDEFYAISMYHQMHCLNSFRRIFIGHRNASRAGHDVLHEFHCLQYLRQMVLCAADTSLEPAFLAVNTDGRKTQAAYGTGVIHQCKDWVQVRNYAEENFALWKDEASDFAVSELSAINS